ncbi:hypothetical protein GCM10022631_10960 [Deinococcus rubellus]|uniref:hypothetical protein n=1 Tax=Deinococcus rubellus TaxID=1889240 RepID=UPI0031EED120
MPETNSHPSPNTPVPDSDHPPTFDQISETIRQTLKVLGPSDDQDSQTLLAELQVTTIDHLSVSRQHTALGLLEAAVTFCISDPEAFAELLTHPALSWGRLSGALAVLIALVGQPGAASLTLLAATSLCLAQQLSPDVESALVDLTLILETGGVIADLQSSQRLIALSVIDRATSHLEQGGQVIGTPDLIAALTPEQLAVARSALEDPGSPGISA